MSTFEDVRLDDAFQARDLAVPMAQAFSLSPNMPLDQAADELRNHRFDQAPVKDGAQILGFVLIRNLAGRGSIHDVMTPLGSGNVVSADASVGQLLEWIVATGFLFVLEGRDITGFITVSDFNKQPARGYLYLLLARLETGLADLVRRRFGPDQTAALALLSGEDRLTVLERYEDDRGAHEEGELLAYLDFSDLVRVLREDGVIRGWIGDWSATRWSNQMGGLVELRNQVMHPVRNIVLAKGGLIKLWEREQRIRDLVRRIDHAIRTTG